METPFAMYDALAWLDVPPEKVRVVVQSMERDLALFATHSRFSGLDQQAVGRFDLLCAEIAASRERMAQWESRMDRLEAHMDERFARVDARFATMPQQLEQRLTRRLGAIMTAGFTVLSVLIALLRR